MKAEDSIFAGWCSQEVQAGFEEMVAALEKERGGRPFRDPDAVLLRLYLQRLERTPGDAVEQLLNLGFMAQKFDEAGRLHEFRGELLRTLATLGRRAQVELLTSGETS